MLRARIMEAFLAAQPHDEARRLTFMSFGFKHGPPREEDLAFDVRFLANPHYEPELRALTGLDERGRGLHRGRRAPAGVYGTLGLLDFLIPQYVAEGKSHMVVAIGCTGGRHRSVAVAEQLAARYAGREDRRGGTPPRYRQGSGAISA